MCAAAKNCEKINQHALFGGSKSFKVINFYKSKKPITSACYDMQHVCCYSNRGRLEVNLNHTIRLPDPKNSPTTYIR